MQVREIMTEDVTFLNQSENLHKAAQMMKRKGIGCIPVEKNDSLVGMITDRDITMAFAEKGGDLETLTIESAMNGKIRYCFEDEEQDEVMDQMRSLNVRRLPVMDRNKKLVGIVSEADFKRVTR